MTFAACMNETAPLETVTKPGIFIRNNAKEGHNSPTKFQQFLQWSAREK